MTQLPPDVLSALRAAGSDTTRYRWLSCYPCTSPEDLAFAYAAVAWVTNQLNFEGSALVLPVRVDKEGYCLRIDCRALYLEKVIDQLGTKGSGPDPFPEPYFHEDLETAPVTVAVKKTRTVTKVWGGGRYPVDGKVYPAGTKYEATEEYEETVTTAPGKGPFFAQARWLAKAKVLDLVAWTDSLCPVYRWDWFCVFALQEPFYGLAQGSPRTAKDFEKLAGLVRSDEEGVRLRGAVLLSEVAHNNRIIERTPTKYKRGRGWFAESLDFKSSRRLKDVIKDPLKRKRDAGELLWALPNGLMGAGLVNDKDQAIDDADAHIAVDDRTYLQDKVVSSGWKCFLCHSKGTIPVADEFRLAGRDTLAFAFPDPKVAAQVGDLYFTDDLNPFLAADGALYAESVKTLTGQDSAAFILQYQELLWRYLERPVTAEDVAIDTGYPLKVVLAVIEEKGRLDLDQTFVRLLKNRRARRDQVETAFGQLQAVLILVPEQKP